MRLTDRKPQILAEASELLQTRSFTAFSYHDLSQRLSISKASIHHHFATKEELLIALAERYRDGQRAKLEEIDGSFDSPVEKLDALLRVMGRIAESGDRICPLGALQSEFNVIPERARSIVKELFETPKEWLIGVLEEGRERGEMAFAGAASERAVLILAAVQGGLQIARVHGSPEFEAVARQVRSELKSQAPQARNRRDETIFDRKRR